MNLHLFRTILLARWRSAISVLFGTIAVVVILSLILPKKYSATAAVVVDVKSPDPIAGIVLGAMAMPSYMATQVDIITSDRVGQRVVERLRLTEVPELRTEWLEDTGGQGNQRAWIAELLSKKLDVKPSRESNVVNVTYTSTDPKFAAAMANAYVEAYQEINLALKVAPAKQYTSFFEEQSKSLRDVLEKSQARLSEYQRAHGILVTDERLDVETQRLNELTSQLVSVQAQFSDSNTRSSQAKQAADTLQDVISNPVVAGLRAELIRQEAKLQEISAKLGDEHPQVRELKANISELKTRMTTEIGRIGSSIGVTSNINKIRETELKAALAAQRIKVAQMKEQRDEATVMLKDVEAAQRAFDAVTQRLTQASLESQANQTNISILTPATEPSLPSSPKLLLNTIVSVLLGSIFSITFVMIREISDRRVRNLDDISIAIGISPIGVIPKTPNPGAMLAQHRASLLLSGSPPNKKQPA